jgi:hypothetical protein
LAYDSLDGTLQISIRYRKVVVTSESLHSLAGVSVIDPRAHHVQSGDDVIRNISAGMEFIDGMFVMRVHEVRDAAIHAKRFIRFLTVPGGHQK